MAVRPIPLAYVEERQLMPVDSASIKRLIDQDQNLTRDQKERQTAAIHEVVRYCQNKTDCRRSQVLSFFSEKFDSAECNGGCDVCLHRGKHIWTNEDVSEDAIKIIQMFQVFPQDAQITPKNAAECYRGIKGNAKKDLPSNQYFGSGKHWKGEEAERLVEIMVADGGLAQYNVPNAAGWSNSYLMVSTSTSDGLA